MAALAAHLVRFVGIVPAPHRPYFGGTTGTGASGALPAADGRLALEFDELDRLSRIRSE
ncbi:MAG: hypothetical protein V4850_24795 [Myxococcota bacterium]